MRTKDQIQILANIVESSDDAIITETLDGTITSWNTGAERIYGYSAKEILGKSMSVLEPPALFEEMKELTELIKQGDRLHHHETLQSRKDGIIINILLSVSPILDTSENPVAALVIARDITNSKRAEEKLRRSEEIYSVATEQTGQLVYDYDLRTNRCNWSGAIKEVTGYSLEEIQNLGKYFWITSIQPLSMKHVDERLQTMNKTGDRFKEELRLRRKDGIYIDVENKGVCLKDNEGYPYEVIGVLKDITDWNLAIKKVEESEEKYRSFIQNFRGIVFQLDENFVPVFLNGAVEEITGYREEEFTSRIKWKDIIHPDDLSLVLKAEEKIRNSPSPSYGDIEYRIKHRDGRVRCVSEIYQKINSRNGKPEFYQGTIYDVTQKKEMEKFLENIEAARKKEIHHRIKNNLQVISSLLDLQAEKFNKREGIKDSEVMEAFRESQDRVISMALIHEELHKSGGLDKLDFSSYIKELADNLFLTYRLGTIDVSLNMDLEKNIFFDMDTAVPLGMIVNELVSNSLKHAFLGRDRGEIRIKLRREGNRECRNSIGCVESNSKDCESPSFTMIVSDNGVGIPKDLNIEELDSLGFQLVISLVEQLDGELELKRDKGTEFIMKFTVTEKIISFHRKPY
ncbi:TPA: PAS domain S-box protein [Methanosarcina acetivorans]|nr:PAS domain S-box protein [Methanosarcina acetivorans]HIH94823.1 PAS domain S-box protein [Methanosarcina acetivorans]